MNFPWLPAFLEDVLLPIYSYLIWLLLADLIIKISRNDPTVDPHLACLSRTGTGASLRRVSLSEDIQRPYQSRWPRLDCAGVCTWQWHPSSLRTALPRILREGTRVRHPWCIQMLTKSLQMGNTATSPILCDLPLLPTSPSLILQNRKNMCSQLTQHLPVLLA